MRNLVAPWKRDTGDMLRAAAAASVAFGATVATVATVAAGASPTVARASCDLGMLKKYTLTSGQLAGAKWSLRAIDSGDGRYAFDIMIGGLRRAHNSGRFYVKGPTGAPVELGFASSTPGTRPTFVAGAVAQAARDVSVRLSNGSVRSVRTIPPKCGLSPGIAFFFAPVPAGTHPIAISGRDKTGKVIVSWRRRAS
jgi:hypothetical protein